MQDGVWPLMSLLRLSVLSLNIDSSEVLDRGPNTGELHFNVFVSLEDWVEIAIYGRIWRLLVQKLDSVRGKSNHLILQTQIDCESLLDWELK